MLLRKAEEGEDSNYEPSDSDHMVGNRIAEWLEAGRAPGNRKEGKKVAEVVVEC